MRIIAGCRLDCWRQWGLERVGSVEERADDAADETADETGDEAAAVMMSAVMMVRDMVDGGGTASVVMRSCHCRSAERDARESGNHEFLDRLVHITPLYTFCFRCHGQARLGLTED